MGHDFIDGGKKEDSYIVLDNPTKWPDYSHIDSYHEPMVKGKTMQNRLTRMITLLPNK